MSVRTFSIFTSGVHQRFCRRSLYISLYSIAVAVPVFFRSEAAYRFRYSRYILPRFRETYEADIRISGMLLLRFSMLPSFRVSRRRQSNMRPLQIRLHRQKMCRTHDKRREHIRPNVYNRYNRRRITQISTAGMVRHGGAYYKRDNNRDYSRILLPYLYTFTANSVTKS